MPKDKTVITSMLPKALLLEGQGGVSPENYSVLRHLLLDWYDHHGRVLPWRIRPEDRARGRRPDPYAVWLSEIMLQQTTVAAVKPYWERFMARWPSLQALAAAELDEVLTAWAGLGYYARARRLHACAVYVTEVFEGHWPQEEEALKALPGIGAYTAAALAALVFNRPANVVDGNVERVMARLYAVDQLLNKARTKLRALAGALASPERQAQPERHFYPERPGDYAQALMDLGATVCTPRKPACIVCPWRDACAAYARGAPQSYPIKQARVPRPERFGIAFWLERDGAVFLCKRPSEGLLGGMMEIPSTPWRASPWGCNEALDHTPCDQGWNTVPTMAAQGIRGENKESAPPVAAYTPPGIRGETKSIRGENKESAPPVAAYTPPGIRSETKSIRGQQKSMRGENWREVDGTVRHVFTHFSLELYVWCAKAPPVFRNDTGVWVPFDKLDSYALPSVMKKIARLVLDKKALP